jgi:hypothetical protein
MRSSLVVRASDCHVEVATVLGSIPASSDTVESEGAADEAVLNTVHKEKNPKNLPVFDFVHACMRLAKDS